MICDECGANNATIRLLTMSNGQKIERHLCADCMNEMRDKFSAINLNSLAGILGGLLQQFIPTPNPDGERPRMDESLRGLSCPGCSQSYEAFQKSGLLGCAQCYQAFREPLDTMLKGVQGNAQHCGRVPGGGSGEISIRLNIDRLKQRLGRAIAEEEYEEAATLRDRIRALNAELSKGGADHEG